jgi:hypothetical protein
MIEMDTDHPKNKQSIPEPDAGISLASAPLKR